MAEKTLSEAQMRNLVHVRDHGKPVPRSTAGYHCRIKNLTELVWLFGDGTVATTSDQTPSDENGWLEKVVGERLTPAGRAALSRSAL